ncbi:MAG: hypothetical protein PHC84_02640 [Clostridia bacterium]|nr:hypothetical protein [Clostridia bacterium]
MAKGSKGKGYLNLGYLASVILAIIPITNLLLGVYSRFTKKNLPGAIFNILLFPLFWVIDLICIVIYRKLKFLI